MSRDLETLEVVFHKYKMHHGRERELEYRKAIFTLVRRYYLFQPITHEGPRQPGLGTDKDGFPIHVKFLKKPGLRTNTQ